MGSIAGIPTTKISKNHNWSQTFLYKIEFRMGLAFHNVCPELFYLALEVPF